MQSNIADAIWGGGAWEGLLGAGGAFVAAPFVLTYPALIRLGLGLARFLVGCQLAVLSSSCTDGCGSNTRGLAHGVRANRSPGGGRTAVINGTSDCSVVERMGAFYDWSSRMLLRALETWLAFGFVACYLAVRPFRLRVALLKSPWQIKKNLLTHWLMYLLTGPFGFYMEMTKRPRNTLRGKLFLLLMLFAVGFVVRPAGHRPLSEAKWRTVVTQCTAGTQVLSVLGQPDKTLSYASDALRDMESHSSYDAVSVRLHCAYGCQEYWWGSNVVVVDALGRVVGYGGYYRKQ